MTDCRTAHFVAWGLGLMLTASACSRTELWSVGWMDCAEDADCTGDLRCWEGTCREETWYNLGDSAMGTWLAPNNTLTVGGISHNAGESGRPALALDAMGRPTVAWSDDSSGAPEIYVRRFDGNAWTEVGAGSASGGGISNSGYAGRPALALDAAEAPVVAWEDSSVGNYEIFVRRFDGITWVEVGAGSASGGGVSITSPMSQIPAIALDSAGRPVVAWMEGVPGGYEIYVRHFNGTSWDEMGSGSASGGGISNALREAYFPSVAVASSDAVSVAWQEENDAVSGVPPDMIRHMEIYVRTFDGESWGELGASASDGGISNRPGPSTGPCLVLDALGYPVVAWEDAGTGLLETYVRRFNGASWEDVGEGPVSVGGASELHAIEPIAPPSMALDDNGTPVVAWSSSSASTSDNSEIYVRRFTGSVWTELGVGSASGGGISTSAGGSWGPRAAIASGRACVVWHQATALSGEIVLRCADLP